MKNNWPIKKIGEVCEIIMGQSPSSSTYNKSKDGLPFYQGKKDYGELYPTPSVWCSVPVKIVENGDVLISVRAPVGALNIAQEKSCIGRGLAGLRSKKKLNQDFLFYYLKLKSEDISNLGTGSTFTAISKKHLENLEIPLPPLSEQKRIVKRIEELFAKIDEAEKLRKESQKDTAALIPAALHKIFTEGKEKGWKEEKLEGVAESVADGTHDTPKYQSDGFPLITSKNLKPEGLYFGTAKFISKKDYKEINKRSFVSNGDILIGMIGTIGNVTRVRTDKKFSIKNVGLIRPNSKKVLAEYLVYYLHNTRLKDLIITGGTTQKFMSLGMLRKIKIIFPPLSEQKKIVAELDALSEKTHALQNLQSQTTQELKSLRQSILHQAFSSKL